MGARLLRNVKLLVEKFNKTSKTASFAFLLSAKSGGVGLNLIGASRIVLFDIDWNPATDLQAMARIHRDGQKMPCKVYRFLVKGGLDEKIFQRQVHEDGPRECSCGQQSLCFFVFKRRVEEICFALDDREGCQTHDLLGCTCDCQGSPEVKMEIEEVSSADEGEEEEEEKYHGLKKASQVDIEEQEAKIKTRRAAKQPKLRMLMEYRHIDTRAFRSANNKGDGDGEEKID